MDENKTKQNNVIARGQGREMWNAVFWRWYCVNTQQLQLLAQDLNSIYQDNQRFIIDNTWDPETPPITENLLTLNGC